jgi:hypothetical protein
MHFELILQFGGVVVYSGEAMFLNPDIVNVRISKVLFLFLGGKLYICVVYARSRFLPVTQSLPKLFWQAMDAVVKGTRRSLHMVGQYL